MRETNERMRIMQLHAAQSMTQGRMSAKEKATADNVPRKSIIDSKTAKTAFVAITTTSTDQANGANKASSAAPMPIATR